ncbi:MAG TPA: polysaccharide biosynthesis/export family protein [Thiopseudomonas sp.]|nr:polysaccharide biosynthesis/export family protein [Thiopseudomonas sp.]
MVIRYISAALLGLVVSLLSVTVSAQMSAVGDSSTYRLSSGDVIKVTVFGEPDLSIDEVRLTDAGTFSYPFVGEVRARDKTVAQLERDLTAALKGDYLVDPRVSISVLEYREFYISGEVNSPGGYRYQPGLNLRRAIALAGGLTERASTNRITIVRDQDPGRKPERVSLDSPVMPGDTINIDQGFF